MKRSLFTMVLCGISALTGCATAAAPCDVTTPSVVWQSETDTLIAAPGTENRFHVSSIRGHLLGGVTDREGNILIAATVTSNGKPTLAIFDSKQEAHANLGLGDDGDPSLLLKGKNGNSRVVAGMNEHGLPLLILNVGDTLKGPRTRFSFKTVDGVTTPYMVMRSGQGDYAQKSSFNASGAPSFEMTDAKGRVRVRIGLGEGDKPYFELLDEEGRQTWAAK